MKPFQHQKQLFVGNVAYAVTDKELANALEDEAGIRIHHVRIVTDRETGNSRGFAFVDVDRSDTRPVEELVDTVNNAGISLQGRTIHANKAAPRDASGKKGPKPQSGRGHSKTEFAPDPKPLSYDDVW